MTIVSFRDDKEGAAATLKEHGIRFDDLITTSDSRYPVAAGQDLAQWKADVVNQIGADLFFEDAPEVVAKVAPTTQVMMVCDDVMRGWVSKALAQGV